MSRKDAVLKLKQVLLNRRDALRAALAGDLSALTELSLATGELADVALDSAHEEVTSQMAEVESRELGQIEEALQRVAEGNYGSCEECEKPIPLARLEALPYASHCIKCQMQVEKNGSRDWSRSSGGAYDSV
jgi:DnaK suppressor protein